MCFFASMGNVCKSPCESVKTLELDTAAISQILTPGSLSKGTPDNYVRFRYVSRHSETLRQFTFLVSSIHGLFSDGFGTGDFKSRNFPGNAVKRNNFFEKPANSSRK